ncbi:HdeD family acid-resistance protein [Candidatus Aciduliprofundum boonei]|uniref:DUF308 domain-containing protein n=1 Tax=Aciduliprofundum boonei (strain DSM 19572 / T469) TaxID=439481 RepID=B5IGW6_ACIB4|nr:DUF308 domain-containing protein [Candidatus Aciduliprofundum boonei]ADD08690.1 conserved hypothetical protein [Aciduliprofundum boonei T469]EDY34473.1 hypothetical protein ABOONEI_1447 [Aciduliprofundum boonei T469]HII54873.1 hypothetical protein [Candidatus Aciduliprofundum boonei]
MEYTSNIEGPTIDPKPYTNAGIVLTILGILGIIFPKFASGVIVYLIAILLLIGGIVFLIMGIKSTSGKLGGILLGIALLIFGILVIIYPLYALAGLAVLMGSFFMIGGIIYFLLAYTVHPYNGWWAPVISGVLSLILGILVLMSWPGNSEWIIGLFVGIDLLFEGLALITVGKLVK